MRSRWPPCISIRPPFTLLPVPHRCLSRAASFRTASSSSGKSNKVVTHWTRRLPSNFQCDGLLGRLLHGRRHRGGGFSRHTFLALASTQNTSYAAHDLLLDQAQHFRGVVHMPELDLLGPGREAFFQQGLVF